MLGGAGVLEPPSVQRGAARSSKELAEVLRVAEEAAERVSHLGCLAGEQVDGGVVQIDAAEHAPLGFDGLCGVG